MEILFSFLRIVLLLYGCLVLLALFVAERVIFQPPPASYPKSSEILDLTMTDGVRIAAVHLPNPTARFTILFSHGNAEDLGHVVPYLREFQQRGYGVFAYDYRGYGQSDGSPSSQGALQDIEAAYDYLTGTLGVPPERVIPMGYSVGGGPATHLATVRKVGGLVLESSFTSAFRTVTRIPLIPFDRFNNIALVGRLTVPLLVIHGQQDFVVPFRNGQQLFAMAREPKRHLWVAGAGHYDLRERAGENYWQTLAEFAKLIEAQQGKGGGP